MSLVLSMLNLLFEKNTNGCVKVIPRLKFRGKKYFIKTSTWWVAVHIETVINLKIESCHFDHL